MRLSGAASCRVKHVIPYCLSGISNTFNKQCYCTVGKVWTGSRCYSFRPSDWSSKVNIKTVLFIKGSLSTFSVLILVMFFLSTNFWIINKRISFCSNALVNLERLIADTFLRRSHVKPQRTDDYDCTLCLKLLYEPITTPCGHSFCRSCLFQTMDRGVIPVSSFFFFPSPFSNLYEDIISIASYTLFIVSITQFSFTQKSCIFIFR